MRNKVEITVTNSDGSIEEIREIYNDFTLYGLAGYNVGFADLAGKATACTLSPEQADYETVTVSNSDSVYMNSSSTTYPNEDIVIGDDGKRYVEVHTSYVSIADTAGLYRSMLFADYRNRAWTYVNFTFPLTVAFGQSVTVKYVRYIQIPDYVDTVDYLDTPIVVPVAQGVIDIGLLDTNGDLINTIPKNYTIYMPTNISNMGSTQTVVPFLHLRNMSVNNPSYLKMDNARTNYFRLFGNNSPTVVLANNVNVIGRRNIYANMSSSNIYHTSLVTSSYNFFGQSYKYTLSISPDADNVNELNIKSLACGFFGESSKTGSPTYCGLEYESIKDKTVRDMLVYDYNDNFNYLGGWLEFDEPIDISPNQGISLELEFTTNWMPPQAFLDDFPDWELGD